VTRAFEFTPEQQHKDSQKNENEMQLGMRIDRRLVGEQRVYRQLACVRSLASYRQQRASRIYSVSGSRVSLKNILNVHVNVLSRCGRCGDWWQQLPLHCQELHALGAISALNALIVTWDAK
jgi:hypothetical protein